MKIDKWLIGLLLTTAGLTWWFTAPNEKELNRQASHQISDTTIANSVTAIKRMGKLTSLSANITAKVTSDGESSLFSPTMSSQAQALVQCSMDLAKMDESWVSVDGGKMTVILPKDFIIADVIRTGKKNSDNGSWGFTFTDTGEILVKHNEVVLASDLQTQANAMLDIARPIAAQDLQRLFQIPLKASGSNMQVEVIFA